jgi:predicted homoserine dehydrogenase-like protein
MNLIPLLNKRAKPVNVGLIGAGKFGTMFLNQVPFIKGIRVE